MTNEMNVDLEEQQKAPVLDLFVVSEPTSEEILSATPEEDKEVDNFHVLYFIMTQPTITELAAIISADTAKIDNYLSSQGLKSPSFDVDAPTEPLVPSDAP
ncbi:hypothetical protein BTUL_0113g00250 [Botrytis tulipae]|uniref:Uncharacterized protein n=1 Tax=Botrytis tulipae TaxID=87230 RepID=A0A4Z1EG24_9HELO|nr:hypothetical protein BTUL_0113g00250 [Botrytis tulipae]